MDDISRVAPEADEDYEDELIRLVKHSLEQARRGEGRPVSECLVEARARFKQDFPDFVPIQRRAKRPGR
jgi:hypothetical protein